MSEQEISAKNAIELSAIADSNTAAGIVAIGRNEGERLKRCLRSALSQTSKIVYVDSGSTDDSVAFCEAHDVRVVSLDMSKPFTAARARNAGFDALLEAFPDVAYVQFVDGDCEIQADWINTALEALQSRDKLAIVCGRRRERFPERTIYNALCDVEWDTPVGIADACGGDFLVKREAYVAVGGFDPNIIAGEEPELCYRLRQKGYEIERLGAEMTLHDADMQRFGQWWQRAKRCGYAYATVSTKHFADEEKIWFRQALSTLVWGLAIPFVLLLSLLLFGAGTLLATALYGVLAWRIYRGSRDRFETSAVAKAYTLSTVLGKFAETAGIIKYFYERLLKRQAQIIEYKS